MSILFAKVREQLREQILIYPERSLKWLAWTAAPNRTEHLVQPSTGTVNPSKYPGPGEGSRAVPVFPPKATRGIAQA